MKQDENNRELWAELLTSPEFWVGAGLMVAGAAALASGAHGVAALAIAPFGAGLILSDVLGRVVRAARSRAKDAAKVRVQSRVRNRVRNRVRRDDE